MLKTDSFLAGALAALTLAACASDVQTPTPIVLAPSGVDWHDARVVAVSMSDFEFTPAHPVFRVGQPVRLVLVNDGSGHHNFSAPAFFAAATYRQGTALPVGGQIALSEGEKTELDLIPGTPGEYAVECTVFMHAMFGMTGAITVTKGPG
jgi:uncharacterized cupredoxin-like copper-binding protein